MYSNLTSSRQDNAHTKLAIHTRNSVELKPLTQVVIDDFFQYVEIIICSGLGLVKVMN